MATTLYRKGSSGDEVKKIQTALNESGYNLAVDGKYGSKTAAAVKDYQSKNNLATDGVVGANTWGKLFPTTSAESNAGTGTAAEGSSTVDQAQQMLQNKLTRPGEYQSKFSEELDNVLNRIRNGEKFSYDVNGDMLWQQMKDQYSAAGQRAMMDTIGQTAALTGGYGNSYMQQAGQQAYQGYMQEATAQIPQLYQLALEAHNRDRDNLLTEYQLLADRDALDYDRAMTDLNFGYQVGRDEVEDARWQKEFDEALRQFNLLHGVADTGNAGSGGSGGGGGSSRDNSDEEDYGVIGTAHGGYVQDDEGAETIALMQKLAEAGGFTMEDIARMLKNQKS